MKLLGAERLLYMISIHASRKLEHVSKSQIDDVVDWLEQAGVVIVNKAYETHGLYNQLHMHSLAWIPKGFRWKPFTVYGDNDHCLQFQIYWKAVTNAAGALAYLTKQARNKYVQEEILLLNYAKANYLFIK